MKDTIKRGSKYRYMGKLINPLCCENDLANILHPPTGSPCEDSDLPVDKELDAEAEKLRDQLLGKLKGATIVDGVTPRHVPTVLLDGTPLDSLTLEDLLRKSVPSPFGDLRIHETRVDKKVRDAAEIRPSMGLSLSPEFEELQREWCTRISGLMFGERAIRLELNKVNIYSKGGFFRAHVDTPRSGNIGSFVLTFGAFAHEGGQLVVDGSMTPSPCQISSTNETLAGTWVAFFSDTPHEVTPVREGARVTATFFIMDDSSPDTPVKRSRCDSSTESERDVPGEQPSSAATGAGHGEDGATADRQGDLACPDFAPVRGVGGNASVTDLVIQFMLANGMKSLGFLLSHKFAFLEMETGVLKGKDANLGHALRAGPQTHDRLAVAVQCVPVTFRIVASWCEWDENMISTEVYRLTREDLEAEIREWQTFLANQAAERGRRHSWHAIQKFQRKKEHSKKPPEGLTAAPRCDFIHLDYSVALHYSEEEIDFTGNESAGRCDDNVYLHQALVVTLRENQPAQIDDQATAGEGGEPSH